MQEHVLAPSSRSNRLLKKDFDGIASREDSLAKGMTDVPG